MEVNELINHINELSDEQETPSLILEFVNDAIAKVNVECDANFPFLRLDTTNITFLPEKWVRVLLVPFAVGRVKQRDSSEFEFSAAYSEFLANVVEFQAKYNIPDEYKDLSSQGNHEGDVFSRPGWQFGGW